MKPFWRLVLLCLLALALPLQGLAAAFHGQGHGQARGAETTAETGPHAGHGEVTAPCHEPESQDNQEGLESPECSVCAACCVAAALTGNAPGWRSAVPADAPQVAVSSGPKPIQASRLERPPRTMSL